MKKLLYRTPEFFFAEIEEELILCQSVGGSLEDFSSSDSDFYMF
jgi:hypothetical protein